MCRDRHPRVDACIHPSVDPTHPLHCYSGGANRVMCLHAHLRHPCMVKAIANEGASAMRRVFPAIVLIVLAPLVAEVLAGSTPLTMPALLVVDVLIYGSGALLIRELVRRRRRGWPSILLMGAAYGLIEEGLALQSLFNPGYGSVAHWGARVAGINGVYTVVSILVHMVWSVAVPILLTELLFPA